MPSNRELNVSIVIAKNHGLGDELASTLDTSRGVGEWQAVDIF